jgi:cell division septal protein FtsQ
MKTATLALSRQAFRIALVVIIIAFLGILVWIYLKFGDFLIGKIAVTGDAQILATIDLDKLEQLETQRQERLNKPYLPEIHNPFLAAPKQPPTSIP